MIEMAGTSRTVLWIDDDTEQRRFGEATHPGVELTEALIARLANVIAIVDLLQDHG